MLANAAICVVPLANRTRQGKVGGLNILGLLGHPSMVARYMRGREKKKDLFAMSKCKALEGTVRQPPRPGRRPPDQLGCRTGSRGTPRFHRGDKSDKT